MKMKKEIVTMLLAAALMTSSLTACTNVEAVGNDIDNTTTEESSENTLKGIETILSGSYYHYYKIEQAFEFCCDIYNSQGEIIFSEKTQRPLTVSEIHPDLIEIRIGYGTGIIGHRFYSVEKEQMSEEFFYVVAKHGTQIAYLSGDANHRKLIVQDVYLPIDSGQCFTLNFSPTHTPVVEADFSEDGSKLSLTYLEGLAYATQQATFNIE